MAEKDISEASLLFSLKQHSGWPIFEEKLKERFESEYKKLRKCNRDSAFNKIQGYLDAIDEIFRIFEQATEDLKEE